MDEFRNLELQKERLIEGLQGLPEKDSVMSALNLAEKSHQGQKRDEGDPYFIHPVRVVNFLIHDLGVKDKDVLIAALLHDVVEDTGVPLKEIKEKFGERVSGFVFSLTRDKKKETKKEKFRKTLKSAEEIKLIKACDCLDNIRSLVYRTDRGDRWQRHLREAREFNIPLAEATGRKKLISDTVEAYEKVLRLD